MNPYEKPITWNEGQPSVGPQLIDFYFYRDAMIDAAKEAYFAQLADNRSMPKHFGKKIKQYHYIPMLDDRNINDQGIDATGASVKNEVTIIMQRPPLLDAHGKDIPGSGLKLYAVGNGDDAAGALAAAKTRAVSVLKNEGISATDYSSAKTALEAEKWTFTEKDAVPSFGNLWGSSKSVGYITSKLPVLGEEGGRVNRVGFTRVTLEGSIEKFGFFTEYTEDSLNFDNENDLLGHITREAVRGANEISERLIQMDLLGAAGVVMYGGSATSMKTVTGESGATQSKLTYEMLMKLNRTLDDNRCPINTQLIKGSQMNDTKTIARARYCYIGSALESTLHKMKDYHNDRAFVPVQMYADAGSVAKGEIGSVGNFRFIVIPEMLYWAGEGASVSSNGGFSQTDGKYDVFPALVVGSGSFATVGFQTDGKDVKFRIIHKKPGERMADRQDPYGLNGFWSIMWWYGSMVLRPEWIACMKVVAEI